MLSARPALLLLTLPLLLSRHPHTAARPAPQTAHGEEERFTVPPDRPSEWWRSFERLLDAEPGSHVSGVSDLKRYFRRFGYLPGQDANFTDSFDERLESAVALYQSKLGLPVTARLDKQTLSQIMSPRCGVGDTVVSAASTGVRRYAFFPGQPRWARSRPMTLTYALSPTATVGYIGTAEVHAALRSAFQRWARAIPVSFVEAQDYEAADVKVGFFAGDHGDGQPFDGVLGVLAHAFSPESGRLHLDAAERWSVDFREERSSVAVDLESVMTHEIGHVLGLAHTSEREAVMYPSLSPRTKKVDLRADDVEGAQALYGSNPNFRLSSLLESDTSSAASLKSGRIYMNNNRIIRTSWIVRTFGIRILVVVAVAAAAAAAPLCT